MGFFDFTIEEEMYLSGEKPICCRKCTPEKVQNMRMITCTVCGNKRCPKATDHNNECTNSNASGQEGSVYA